MVEIKFAEKILSKIQKTVFFIVYYMKRVGIRANTNPPIEYSPTAKIFCCEQISVQENITLNSYFIIGTSSKRVKEENGEQMK